MGPFSHKGVTKTHTHTNKFVDKRVWHSLGSSPFAAIARAPSLSSFGVKLAV